MTRSANTIRVEMDQVRREMAEDMGDVVESARQMTDWRSYVYRFPMMSVGAAAVVGFMLVPKRTQIISPDVDTLLRMAKRNKLVVTTHEKGQAPSGIGSTLTAIVVGAVVRGGMNFVSQQLGKAVREGAKRVGTPVTPEI